ncbi:hypothetical protein CDAR_101331 [Caerostris darwini]|uniref:Uncharacterized protein n=1 Tax=Caerostris darwini TaxID=1538125 RepID=A0AAV4SLF2_9ARAC|nr:hypothetical protein CDAR_101331 [Caerostris darwini]
MVEQEVKEEKNLLRSGLSHAAEGVGVHEVHRRMKTVNLEYKLSMNLVQDWHKCFYEGRESLKEDSPQKRSKPPRHHE